MSLAIAGRIARRELRGGIKGFRVFLICLALGVAAIAAVGSVREAIEAGLEREGATILGGDASLSFTYRFANDEERAWIDEVATEVSEIADFRSMAVVTRDSGTERGLTQVKAVDAAYPLYGAPRLDPPGSLSDALEGEGGLPGAVIDPVLAARLDLEVGETFDLGTQTFVLSALLEREPDSATGGFALGPRTIVRTADLANSGLLRAGTLFETQYRLIVPDGADLDALSTRADAELSASGARWQDRRNGAPGVSEFVDRLSTFLVLVGLAGLAVGGVGVSSAVNAYLGEKTGVIATLKSLGAPTKVVFQSYFIQIGILALAGVAIGVALGGVLPLIFAPIIEARLPVPAEFGLFPEPLAEAALYGVLAALVFTIWPLARTEHIRAAELFRDGALGASSWPRRPWMAATAIAFAVLVGVAAWLSGLAVLTLWSAAGIAAAFVLLVLASTGVRWIARRLSRSGMLRGRTTARLAMGSVGGPGGETTSVVLAIGLGLTVLAAIGQIDTNLRGAIARDLPEVAPSFFVVDIQNDQLPGFRDILAEIPEVSDIESAPMLRGIITGINGQPASEVAGEHWVLQGDRGITYSAEIPESTVVTAGTWWDADYSGPPQVSFAAEEAEEMGLALGDTLTINVLGRDIDAEITSFREVDFSTAGIGFILSMNPGALAGAPHTHIATVYSEPEAEAEILRSVSTAYPNITSIRVRDAIDRVSELLTGIASAITYGALATLVTGGVVLIGTAAASERARVYEAALLKTLGASRRAILANFALRSAMLGAAAGIVAVIAGMIAGWAVMTFVLDTEYVPEPVSAIAIVLGGVVATLIAGLAFAWRPLAARPAQTLRARE